MEQSRIEDLRNKHGETLKAVRIKKHKYGFTTQDALRVINLERNLYGKLHMLCQAINSSLNPQYLQATPERVQRIDSQMQFLVLWNEKPTKKEHISKLTSLEDEILSLEKIDMHGEALDFLKKVFREADNYAKKKVIIWGDKVDLFERYVKFDQTEITNYFGISLDSNAKLLGEVLNKGGREINKTLEERAIDELVKRRWEKYITKEEDPEYIEGITHNNLFKGNCPQEIVKIVFNRLNEEELTERVEEQERMINLLISDPYINEELRFTYQNQREKSLLEYLKFDDTECGIYLMKIVSRNKKYLRELLKII